MWRTGPSQRDVECFFRASQKVKEIVIADATGVKALTVEEENLLQKMGCAVEQIIYKQDVDELRRRGKGYAEGRLIEYSLNNSTILRGRSSFYKSTGKTFCRNFSKIENFVSTNSLNSLFWFGSFSGADLRFVDLRFFYCSKEFFLKSVLSGYNNCDENRRLAEEQVTIAISQGLAPMTSLKPQVSGFCGGLDAQYPEMYLGDLEYKFPCLVQKQHWQWHPADQTRSRGVRRTQGEELDIEEVPACRGIGASQYWRPFRFGWKDVLGRC